MNEDYTNYDAVYEAFLEILKREDSQAWREFCEEALRECIYQIEEGRI